MTWAVLQRTFRPQPLINIYGILSGSTFTKLSRKEFLANTPLLDTHPWMNGSIRRLIRQKQRAHEKSRQTGLKPDHDRYKQLQQDVQYQIRSAHKTYMKEAVSNSLKDNLKKFWSIIKDKVQEATRVSPLKNKDGFIKSDSQSKANVLNDQFVSAFKKEDISSLQDKGPSPYPTMPHIKVN